MQFPNQMLTNSQKIERYGSIENWAKSVFNYVDQLLGTIPQSYSNRFYDMQALYELRAGNLCADDYKSMNDYTGIIPEDNNPINIGNHPLIFDICNSLLGEEQAKPFNFMAMQSNPDVVTKTMEEKKKLVSLMLESFYKDELSKTGEIADEQLQNDQGWQKGHTFSSVEEIEKHMQSTYKDELEIQAQHAINYLAQVCNAKMKFDKGYDHMLTSGRQIYYVGSNNNEPNLRVCNPLFIDFDNSPDIDRIEDCAWVREIEFIPVSVAYERYYKVLKPEDIEKLENIKGQNLVRANYPGYPINGTMPYDMVYNSPGSGSSYYNNNLNIYNNGSTMITAKHLCWVGLRKVVHIGYIDEQGLLQESIVDEDYKKTGKEIFYEEHWINEVYEATQLGGPLTSDIFVNVGPRRNQHKSINNPSKCKLPYVGLIHRSINAREISIVRMLRHYQRLYNIMWDRLEIAIARAKGKILLFDITQIPKQYDTPVWLDFLFKQGIAFIDPSQESNKGMPSSFNQFREFDLTISQSIGQYMSIISMIKQAAADLVGISSQRMGDIAASETVSNVNTSINRSTIATNYLTVAHNDCKKRVLTMLIEESQSCWIDGKQGQYMMSDTDRILFQVNPDEYPYADFDIFVNNSVKDASILDFIKQQSHAAIQNNQAKLSDIIKVLQSDSIAQASSILGFSEEKLAEEQQKIAQINNEAMIQSKQMDIQMQKEKEDREDIRKDKELTTSKEIAQIKALGFAQDKDINKNNIPDVIEVEKLREDKRKNMTDQVLKAADIKTQNKKIDTELVKASLDANVKKEEMALKESEGSGI